MLKPRYHECVCTKCKGIDFDKVFAEGFDKSIKIRAKGDFFESTEGFLCVSQKVKLVIESAQYCGIVAKPFLGTDWSVVNVSLRVNADQRAYTLKNHCDQCGRARQTHGLIRCLNQIDAPKQSGSFFSPVFDRGGTVDRDLFVTEDIVSQFKQQGLKGGVFSRLLTPLEYEAVKAAGAEFNSLKWPKGSQVVL